MPIPAAVVVGVLDLVRMLCGKKRRVNDALAFLVEAGLNVESFKAARRSIDESADRIAAGKPEELVLPADQVVALDCLLDRLSQALHAAGRGIGVE
jgi:hypothetical protein